MDIEEKELSSSLLSFTSNLIFLVELTECGLIPPEISLTLIKFLKLNLKEHHERI